MKLRAMSALLAVTALACAQDSQARVQEKLKEVDAVIAKGPFQANWESLENFKVPAWYADAKFGIFIHWGVYAVPAFGNEWYPRNMYLREANASFKHHVETFGPQSQVRLQGLHPACSRPRSTTRTAWATLFKNAGAKFVVPVAEHHDGFPMYDCAFTDWSAAKMGPKRDVVGDLASAVRKQGMHFGASSHRAEHWWFFDGGMKFDSDVKDPKIRRPVRPGAAASRLPTARATTSPTGRT